MDRVGREAVVVGVNGARWVFKNGLAHVLLPVPSGPEAPVRRTHCGLQIEQSQMVFTVCPSMFPCQGCLLNAGPRREPTVY